MRNDGIAYVRCPLCKYPFQNTGNSLSCKNNHTFDFSRDGYINLLLPNQKRSINPGDTKDMLLARRIFLEKGFYAPLSQTINTVSLQHLTDNNRNKRVILDVGCGEGYYTHALQVSLENDDIFLAMDISKDAISLASKKYNDILFFVGNIAKEIPVASESVSIILNVFAPRNPDEFARMLHPQGILIVVIPAQNHLIQLRDLAKNNKVREDKIDYITESFQNQFLLLENKQLAYTMILQNEALLALVRMTPVYWQLSENEWRKLQKIESLEVDAKFRILVFKKISLLQ